jgi:hypothetical protein
VPPRLELGVAVDVAGEKKKKRKKKKKKNPINGE